MFPTLKRKTPHTRSKMPTWRKIDAAPADIITSYIYACVLYTYIHTHIMYERVR